MSSTLGDSISSRFIAPNAGEIALTVSTICFLSVVLRQSGNALIFPYSLYKTDFPSITGIAALGPMFPSPNILVPSVIIATLFPFEVN